MPYAGPEEGRFAYVLFPNLWTEMTVSLNELSARYARAGRRKAADIIVKAWAQARAEQLTLGREMAAWATEQLRAEEKRSRVRPDTLGQGGARLEDWLVAEPMPYQTVLPGSIGIADQELLENHVPWWITNEIGNTTRVGEKLFGLFYGGDDEAPPNMDEFRVHPLFAPAPARAGGGQGTIRHGIPERRFIKRSIPAIDREWHARFNAIRSKVAAEMSRAAVTFE